MESPRSIPPWLGYAYVAGAAGLWAVSGSAAKFLFLNRMSPVQLVQLRTSIAASLLFLILLAAMRCHLKVQRKDLVNLVVLGMVLAAAQFTYLYAISRITVAAAILLQYQAPVLIAGHALIFRHRRLSAYTLAALFGALAGCYFIVGAYDLDMVTLNREGIISGLASACAFAVYAVKSESCMCSYSPWTVVFYALFFAAVIWNVLAPPFSAFTVPYSTESWWWILFIGVFGTIVPFGLYNEGIKLIRATRASIIATLEPVIAGGISFFFLGEVMGPHQLAGGGMVILSILLLQIRKDPD